MAVNLAFVFAAAPFVAWYASLLKIPDGRLVALVVALMALDTVNNVPFLIMKATRRSRQYIAVKWVAAIAQFVIIVALVGGLKLGLMGAMVGWVAGTALQTIIYFAMLRGQFSLVFSFAELGPCSGSVCR